MYTVTWKQGHSRQNPGGPGHGLWITNTQEHNSSQKVKVVVRARTCALCKACGSICDCACRSKCQEGLQLANMLSKAESA